MSEKDVCDIKHEHIDKKLAEHDRMLKEHDDKIDRLEQDNSTFRERFDNLINQLKDLSSALRWLTITIIVTLVGIVVYVIEQGL